MEKNDIVTIASSCKNCVIQSNINKSYAEKILDLQSQISTLSSRLLKYESDSGLLKEICEVKIEEVCENGLVTFDHDDVSNIINHNDSPEPDSDRYSDPDYISDQTKDIISNQDSDLSNQDIKSSATVTKSSKKTRKCKTCSAQFSSSRAVLKHQHEIHGEAIKFKCQRCPRTFYDSNSLKKHSGTKHKSTTDAQKEKPRFYCDTCAKSFTSKSVLLVHKRIHTGEKPYKCTSCGNRYAQSSSLKIHERTHSNERIYMCHLCSKTFLHRSSFNLHIKTHGDIRPHKCSICDKAFLQKAKLAVHMQSHTGERPVKCPVCEKGYTKRYHVRKHLKNFHKIVDIDAVLGSRKRGFERDPIPYDKLPSMLVKKD